MIHRTLLQLRTTSRRAGLLLTGMLLFVGTAAQALTIDSGGAFSNHTSVQLHLTLPANCYQVQIQNESEAPVVLASPAATIPWTLSAGDGPKTVTVTYSYYYYYQYQCGSYQYTCGSYCCGFLCSRTCYNYCTGYNYCQGQGTSTSTETANITLDRLPPLLTITSPPEGTNSGSSSIGINGTASDLNGISALTVNGQPASVGAFDLYGATVDLHPGANDIAAVATDNAGNTQIAHRTVYYNPPVNGACGTADGQVFTTAPDSNLCNGGAASALSGSGPWSWSCAGHNGGSTADCGAILKSWTVTPSAGDHGSITSGTPQTSGHGATAAFTVTADDGYRISDVTGSCGGTLEGSTYTTNAVTADCTVAASFARNMATLTVNQAGSGDGAVSLSLAGSSATPHDGRLVNSPVWTPGMFGNGLSLSNGQYVTVPDPTGDLNITGDLTIALWVNPTSVSCSGADPAYALVSKRSVNHATPYEFYIGCGGSLNLHAWATKIQWPTVTATGTLTTGAWQHLAVTRSYDGDNATVTFYVNGVAAGSSTLATGPALGSTDPLWISRDGYHTTYTDQGSYNGSMDEVQIYNRALSATEIGRIYSNDAASLSNRIGNWHLDETSGTTAADSMLLNCTGGCSKDYGLGTVVELSTTPAPGSVFAGWSGDADCADGSITLAAATTCTATFMPASYQLTVTTSGNGNGTVTSIPASIACASGGVAGCSATLDQGTGVTLTPTPSGISLFGGWAGDCNGTGDCAFSMTDTKSVNARFDLADKARIGSASYDSLAAAYNDAGTAAVILLLDDLLPINWSIDKTVTLRGGHNCSFDSQPGYTTLDGILKIRSGCLRLERVKVK